MGGMWAWPDGSEMGWAMSGAERLLLPSFQALSLSLKQTPSTACWQRVLDPCFGTLSAHTSGLVACEHTNLYLTPPGQSLIRISRGRSRDAVLPGANARLLLQAFYYPQEAGVAFGGPGSSRFLRLEVHYHNPLLIAGRASSLAGHDPSGHSTVGRTLSLQC